MTDEPTTEAPAAPAGSDEEKSADKGKKGKKKEKKEKQAKGGRSNLVPALVLAMGIAAGGYFVGGSGASADPDAVGAEQIDVVAELEPGEVVELEAMTVNLANGRFLRVGVAVLTSSEFESVEGDPRQFKPEHQSRLRDQLIAMFAGRDVGTLTGAENLDAAKAEMLDRANVVLDGHALEVYLTEFVSQ